MGILTFMLPIVVTACLFVQADYTCYISSSPEAKMISSVYDDNENRGAFWVQNRSELESCNFSSLYSSSQHSVCLDNSVIPEIVLVVLSNLTSNMKLVFEWSKGSLNFNQTDCPARKPVGSSRPGTTEPSNTETNNERHTTPAAIAIPAVTRPNHNRGRFFLHAALVCFVLLIIIIFIAYKLYKSQQTPGDGRCSVPQSESTAISMNGNGNSEPLVA